MATETFDLLGLGFGPAGIALAAAIDDWAEEHGTLCPWNVRFLEQQADSQWQSGLLLPGCNIRHHHFRDLATPRNPRSRFTFANYLKESDRLFEFCLLRGGVGRIEWSDYVSWVSRALSDYVTYDTRAVAVEPHVGSGSNGDIDFIRVRTENDEYLTRNLVLGTGQRPHVPELFEPHLGERCFHTVDYLSHLEAFDPSDALRFTLIGAGQSAAEALLHLHGLYRHSRVTCVQKSFGFRLTDEAPFSQMTYLPEETNYFFELSPEQRERERDQVRATNYSVVDWDVCVDLYWKMYEEGIQGDSRIQIINRSRVVDIQPSGDGFRLVVEEVNTGERSVHETDVLVLCTGFREELFPSLLEGLEPYVQRDEQGGVRVSRDYRVQTSEGFKPGLFLNGLTERTHGLSDSASFSMMALKAEEVFNACLRPDRIDTDELRPAATSPSAVPRAGVMQTYDSGTSGQEMIE